MSTSHNIKIISSPNGHVNGNLKKTDLPIDNILRLCYHPPLNLLEPLAQPVEQLPFKQWVVGSSPTRLILMEFKMIAPLLVIYFAKGRSARPTQRYDENSPTRLGPGRAFWFKKLTQQLIRNEQVASSILADGFQTFLLPIWLDGRLLH